MALPERLQVILELKGDQYKRETREVASATGKIRTETAKAGTATQRLDTRMGKLGRTSRTTESRLKGVAGKLAAFAAGGILARGLKSATDRAELLNSQYAITAKVLETTGGAANVTAEEVKELSRQSSLLTGVDKALVTEANNVILTFKGIRNEMGEGNQIFDRTAALVLDVAAVMGNNAPSAAKQLAKALNDPVSQLGALGEAGLTFTAEQKEMIKELTNSGHLLEAQKIILSELESQLGGTAAASADASDKIANAFKELQETAGLIALPFLDQAGIEAQFLSGQIDDIERMALITGQAEDTVGFLGGRINEIAGNLAEHGAQRLPFIEQIEELFARVDASPETIQKLHDGLGTLVSDFDLTEEGAKIVADILQDELNEQLGKAQAIAADSKFLQMASELQEVEDEAHDVAAELGHIRDEYETLLTPALGGLDALQRHIDAQDDLNQAISEFGPESQEARDAGLEVLGTYEGLIAAAQTYADTSGQSVIESIEELGEKAGLPRSVILEIIEALNELDGFVANPTIDITTRGGDAFGSINQVLNPRDRAGERQHGGATEPGKLYRVGENDLAEMYLIPGDRGRVLSNRDTRQLIAAMAGAGGTGGERHHHYHLEGTGDPEVDAQRLAATHSVVRRMETR